MPFYTATGDFLHSVNLLNIAVYGSSLYRYGMEDSTSFSSSPSIFDKEWLKDGFCLPHGNRPFLTTHDLSGYLMVIMALFGIGLQYFLSPKSMHKIVVDGGCDQQVRSSANRRAFWALVGALGHAAGHFLISTGKRNHYYPSDPNERFIDDLKRSSMLVAIGKAGPGYPLFWIPLVKTYMMNTARNRVALVAFVVNCVSLLVPVKFGFSYTQAVLFGGMSIDQLMLPAEEKNTFEYALWPLLTTIPNGIFAWIECLTCTTNPLMRSHGHLVYDLYMVSSYIIFYLICWSRTKKVSGKEKIF